MLDGIMFLVLLPIVMPIVAVTIIAAIATTSYVLNYFRTRK